MPKNRFGETISYVGDDGKIPYEKLGVQDQIVGVRVDSVTVSDNPEKKVLLLNPNTEERIPAMVSARVFKEGSPVEDDILKAFHFTDVCITYLTGALLTQYAVDKLVETSKNKDISEEERKAASEKLGKIFDFEGELTKGTRIDCVGPSREVKFTR